MDLINKLLNIVVLPIALSVLSFMLPPYFFFKFMLLTLREINGENVAGKVVLITGASSGIGEVRTLLVGMHLAYEYARRGTCLSLVATRETLLRLVAATSELIGSPDAIIIPGDVSKAEDCKRCVDATMKHFRRYAGLSPVSMFESVPDINKFALIIDIKFWGSVYCSCFAIPHLNRSKGKIVVIASCAVWLPAPRMSFYNASKAALVAMYETLRVELGSDIGITIVMPGLIESEMAGGPSKCFAIRSLHQCAKAIVNAACRGEKNKTEPARRFWHQVIFYWRVFLPKTIEWCNRIFLMPQHGQSESDTLSKKILDLVRQLEEFFTSTTDRSELPELVASLDNGNLLHRTYLQS